jgi:hypothetical protein
MEINTPVGKAETDEFFYDEPFKAMTTADGEWHWFVSAGDFIRLAHIHDVLDVVNRINDQFGLNGTRDELLLGQPNLRPQIWSEIGFDCTYRSVNEALDYLMEGTKQDDFYDMLEAIERMD